MATTTPTSGRVVLNLDTPEASFILFDGKEYEFLTAETLTPLAGYQLLQCSRRSDVLTQKEGELTEDEQREIEALPDKMCRLVFMAPDEVHARLTGPQRMAIVSAFLHRKKPAVTAASL